MQWRGCSRPCMGSVCACGEYGVGCRDLGRYATGARISWGWLPAVGEPGPRRGADLAAARQSIGSWEMPGSAGTPAGMHRPPSVPGGPSGWYRPEAMSSPQGRPVVIRNTNSCCQGSGCGFVILVILAVVVWNSLPRWADWLIVVGVGGPLLALGGAAVYYKLNPKAAPLVGPNGLRSRRRAKPRREGPAQFQIANYNGGFSAYPSPEPKGSLVLPFANRWELYLAGSSQHLLGKLTRFTFEVTESGPASCHVAAYDKQDPTDRAEFDLPKTAASVAQHALATQRFAFANYDGGLPLDSTPRTGGAFVLTPDDRWQVHFKTTERWLYGPCARYRFEVIETGPSSCRLTMRSVRDAGVAASFELPDDSAAEVRQCLPAESQREERLVRAVGHLQPEPIPSGPATSVLEQIRQLAAMRDSGILTEEEFAAKKADLLNRL